MPPRPKLHHSFDLTIPEARALQERLRSRVCEEELPRVLRRVAGADVSYDRGSPVLSPRWWSSIRRPST